MKVIKIFIIVIIGLLACKIAFAVSSSNDKVVVKIVNDTQQDFTLLNPTKTLKPSESTTREATIPKKPAKNEEIRINVSELAKSPLLSSKECGSCGYSIDHPGIKGERCSERGICVPTCERCE